jgi:hypothetical protein
MKKIVGLWIVWMLACGAAHAQIYGDQVLYVGGTIASVKSGAIGKFNLTGADALAFESGGGHLAIPYARIESYEYASRRAHRAGAIPTAVVLALLKHKHYQHYVTIAFKDEQGVAQLAVFEVAKDIPTVILPVLKARAPSAAPRAQWSRASFR